MAYYALEFPEPDRVFELRNIFPGLFLLAKGKGRGRHVVNQVPQPYVDCCLLLQPKLSMAIFP